MMKKSLLLTAIAGFVSFTGFAEELTKVPLSSFKDTNFQAYLKAEHGGQVVGNDIYIDNITKIDVSHGTYQNIKSLEGIKQFVNLEALYLPSLAGTNANNTRFQLGNIDVSGMPNLKVIDNGSYVTYTISLTKPEETEAKVNTYTPNGPNTKDIISVNNESKNLFTINAANCPDLEYVALAGYTYLETLNLSGCENIHTLYLGRNSALKSIDISGMPKLSNRKIVQKNANSFSYTDNKDVDEDNFCLTTVNALEELKLGTHENLGVFFIDGNFKFETLDISGMPNLTKFVIEGRSDKATTPESSKPVWNNSNPKLDTELWPNYDFIEDLKTYYEFRSITPLESIILPSYMPKMEYLYIRETRLRHIDVTPFCNTLKVCDLEANMLIDFDIEKFSNSQTLTSLNLRNNCIHELGVVPPKVTSFSYNNNRLAIMPDHGRPMTSSAVKLKIFDDEIKLQQHIFVPQEATEYKCFEDENLVQYVMKADHNDPKWTVDMNMMGKRSILRLYSAPYGGHFGNKDKGEDPCTFYFDKNAEKAYYYIEYNVQPEKGKTSSWNPSTNLNKLSDDEKFVAYYLRPRYCKVYLYRVGYDVIDEEWINSQKPQEPEVPEIPTKGGLIQSVTTHYGGIGEVPQTETITWVSGRIHKKKEESDMEYSHVDFDPEEHHIDFPATSKNEADVLKLAKDNVSVSLIVELSPDEHSENCSALVCIDIIDNNGNMTPLLNKEEIWEVEDNKRVYKGDKVISDTPIFYQVYPETEETAKPLNVATIDEEETEHNESGFVSGTTSDFEADYTWNHPDVAAKTATVEIPIANQIWKAYQTMVNKSGTIGQIRTYVLEEPTTLLTKDAVKLVNGEDDAPKYLYMVTVPLSVDENVATGVGNISSDSSDNSNAPVEYYTITGVRTDGTAPGLYIRRQGNTATKVLVK